jgi:hypothetical protein
MQRKLVSELSHGSSVTRWAPAVANWYVSRAHLAGGTLDSGPTAKGLRVELSVAVRRYRAMRDRRAASCIRISSRSGDNGLR